MGPNDPLGGPSHFVRSVPDVLQAAPPIALGFTAGILFGLLALFVSFSDAMLVLGCGLFGAAAALLWSGRERVVDAIRVLAGGRDEV